MTSKGILNLLRKYGTEATVRAILEKDAKEFGTRKKQDLFMSKLLTMLEKKKVLRRGNLVALICEVEGIKEPVDEAADE